MLGVVAGQNEQKHMENPASETNRQNTGVATTQGERPIAPSQLPPAHSSLRPPRFDQERVHRAREWRLSDFVPVVITLLNGIGWIIIYLYVLSPQADQNKAQTRLFDQQLARLQGTNQRMLDQLDVREKREQCWRMGTLVKK
jgi:hypothetical protein